MFPHHDDTSIVPDLLAEYALFSGNGDSSIPRGLLDDDPDRYTKHSRGPVARFEKLFRNFQEFRIPD
jgi:hypothetical protein